MMVEGRPFVFVCRHTLRTFSSRSIHTSRSPAFTRRRISSATKGSRLVFYLRISLQSVRTVITVLNCCWWWFFLMRSPCVQAYVRLAYSRQGLSRYEAPEGESVDYCLRRERYGLLSYYCSTYCGVLLLSDLKNGRLTCLGAGKTESQKYVLRYLCELWGTHAGPIEKRILESKFCTI